MGMTTATHFNGSTNAVDSAHVSPGSEYISGTPHSESSHDSGVVIDVRDGVVLSCTTPSDVTPSGTNSASGEDPARTWSIAQLAEEFDVTHRTLRYYESLGLVSPQRVGTRRVFSRRDRVRLSLVLRGKRLGFGLDEIAKIVDMYSEGNGVSGQLEYVLSQLSDRRTDLERRLSEAQSALAELDQLQKDCAAKLGLS